MFEKINMPCCSQIKNALDVDVHDKIQVQMLKHSSSAFTNNTVYSFCSQAVHQLFKM